MPRRARPVSVWVPPSQQIGTSTDDDERTLRLARLFGGASTESTTDSPPPTRRADGTRSSAAATACGHPPKPDVRRRWQHTAAATTSTTTDDQVAGASAPGEETPRDSAEGIGGASTTSTNSTATATATATTPEQTGDEKGGQENTPATSLLQQLPPAAVAARRALWESGPTPPPTVTRKGTRPLINPKRETTSTPLPQTSPSCQPSTTQPATAVVVVPAPNTATASGAGAPANRKQTTANTVAAPPKTRAKAAPKPKRDGATVSAAAAPTGTATPAPTARTATARTATASSSRSRPDSTSGTIKFKPSGPSCPVCVKSVFKMEEVLCDAQSFHKWCFRCTIPECNKRLTAGKYASYKGSFYCKPCFMKCFKQHGNYDKGFGHEQHKMRWSSMSGSGPAADQTLASPASTTTFAAGDAAAASPRAGSQSSTESRISPEPTGIESTG